MDKLNKAQINVRFSDLFIVDPKLSFGSTAAAAETSARWVTFELYPDQFRVIFSLIEMTIFKVMASRAMSYIPTIIIDNVN